MRGCCRWGDFWKDLFKTQSYCKIVDVEKILHNSEGICYSFAEIFRGRQEKILDTLSFFLYDSRGDGCE